MGERVDSTHWTIHVYEKIKIRCKIEMRCRRTKKTLAHRESFSSLPFSSINLLPESTLRWVKQSTLVTESARRLEGVAKTVKDTKCASVASSDSCVQFDRLHLPLIKEHLRFINKGIIFIPCNFFPQAACIVSL